MGAAPAAAIGACDAKKLDVEPITLRLACPERDHFEPLGGRPDGFPLNPDLVVYAQNADILCWGLSYHAACTLNPAWTAC